MGALGCFSPNHHQTTLEFSAICLHLAFQQFLKQTQEVFETFLCFLNLTASQIVHTSQALHSSLKIPGNQLKTHLLFHGIIYILCIYCTSTLQLWCADSETGMSTRICKYRYLGIAIYLNIGFNSCKYLLKALRGGAVEIGFGT